MGRRKLFAAAAAALLLVICLGAVATRPGVAAPARRPACGTKVGKHPMTYRHVVWIVFENKAYGDVIGSSAAPYLNGLAASCGLATNYYAISHPSLPNYIAMTSGDTQGITDDAAPSAHPVSAPSIFSQLGAGWSARDESMPTPCAVDSSGLYAVKHNPAAYFTNLRSSCAAHDVAGGISATGRFTFVTPNLCHDMHDCGVGAGDAWLAAHLPAFLSSVAYTSGGTAVFITWDEADHSSANRVPTLVVSPYTRRGARSSVRFDHYSLLKTTESMLGLKCLAAACHAASMRAAFGL